MSDLRQIPLNKLEKIHYAVLKLIEEREKTGQLEGRAVKLTPSFLRDIFKEADKGPQPGPEDMLGLHYYLAAIKALPIEAARNIEIQQAREIKRRKEIYRQKIDAGNIEKEVKKICRP